MLCGKDKKKSLQVYKTTRQQAVLMVEKIYLLL